MEGELAQKTEALMQLLADLSSDYGVKLLVMYALTREKKIKPLICAAQCVLQLPPTSTSKIVFSQDSVSVSNLSGDVLVFDSISSEEEVSERRIPGTRVLTHTKFSVHVSGVVAAMLSPSVAESFKLVRAKRRWTRPAKRSIEVKQEEPESVDLDDLHMQIAMQKQKCAMLMAERPAYSMVVVGSSYSAPYSVPSSNEIITCQSPRDEMAISVLRDLST